MAGGVPGFAATTSAVRLRLTLLLTFRPPFRRGGFFLLANGAVAFRVLFRRDATELVGFSYALGFLLGREAALFRFGTLPSRCRF